MVTMLACPRIRCSATRLPPGSSHRHANVCRSWWTWNRPTPLMRRTAPAIEPGDFQGYPTSLPTLVDFSEQIGARHGLSELSRLFRHVRVFAPTPRSFVRALLPEVGPRLPSVGSSAKQTTNRELGKGGTMKRALCAMSLA